jgi:hypothetical protein
MISHKITSSILQSKNYAQIYSNYIQQKCSPKRLKGYNSHSLAAKACPRALLHTKDIQTKNEKVVKKQNKDFNIAHMLIRHRKAGEKNLIIIERLFEKLLSIPSLVDVDNKQGKFRI